MGMAKKYGNLEAAEQIIDSAVPSLAEGELLVNIFPAKIATSKQSQTTSQVFQAISMKLQNPKWNVKIP